MKLALPNPEALALPELLEQAAQALAELPVEQAQEDEARADALATILSRSRGQEEMARRFAALSLVCARRIGEELGEAKRGRPTDDVPLPELVGRERREYRLCAELTPEEFAAWVKAAEAVTRKALAKQGEKLRRCRDRETGEPIPSPDESGEGDQGADEKPPREEAPAPSPPGGHPPQPPPKAHRAQVWLGLLSELLNDLEHAPEDVKPAAAEVIRLLERAREVLQTIA